LNVGHAVLEDIRHLNPVRISEKSPTRDNEGPTLQTFLKIGRIVFFFLRVVLLHLLYVCSVIFFYLDHLHGRALRMFKVEENLDSTLPIPDDYWLTA